MSSAQHAAEKTAHGTSVGRIAPLNMTSGRGGLSYDTLVEDMTAANDYATDAGCWDHCHLWA